MTILDQIIERNRGALEQRRQLVPEAALHHRISSMPPVKDFAVALSRTDRYNIIAELKKASPSKGIIRADFKPEELAVELETAGAAALSILTEEFYFQGSAEYLRCAARLVKIPVLRKDFIFDPYQIIEARAIGADAILLIAAALTPEQFSLLQAAAAAAGLAVLAEVHNQHELEWVCATGVKIIGVNCRDLKTFKTDICATEQVLAAIPGDRIAVAESGIKTTADLKHLRHIRANAFLVGETIMRHPCPGAALHELTGE
jgi:indole-3-glycerol phosphate synthase